MMPPERIGASPPGPPGPPVEAGAEATTPPPRRPLPPEIPAVDFTTVADDLFVAMQHEAERIAVLRVLINDGTLYLARGETKLAEAEQRSRTMVALFNLFLRLAARETEARQALAALLAGDAHAIPPAFGKRSG